MAHQKQKMHFDYMQNYYNNTVVIWGPGNETQQTILQIAPLNFKVSILCCGSAMLQVWLGLGIKNTLLGLGK